MYIRQVTQTAKKTGKKYHTYRLVEAVRTERGARQRLLLNLGLDRQLKILGLNPIQTATAMGTIIGRMLHPGSERATHKWLQEKSGLGELVDYDFNRLSLDKLYKISALHPKNWTVE
ncbi:MAG: hypothetical protein ABFQ95_07175 [Pseudomonadota bacterium]